MADYRDDMDFGETRPDDIHEDVPMPPVLRKTHSVVRVYGSEVSGVTHDSEVNYELSSEVAPRQLPERVVNPGRQTPGRILNRDRQVPAVSNGRVLERNANHGTQVSSDTMNSEFSREKSDGVYSEDISGREDPGVSLRVISGKERTRDEDMERGSRNPYMDSDGDLYEQTLATMENEIDSLPSDYKKYSPLARMGAGYMFPRDNMVQFRFSPQEMMECMRQIYDDMLRLQALKEVMDPDLYRQYMDFGNQPVDPSRYMSMHDVCANDSLYMQNCMHNVVNEYGSRLSEGSPDVDVTRELYGYINVMDPYLDKEPKAPSVHVMQDDPAYYRNVVGRCMDMHQTCLDYDALGAQNRIPFRDYADMRFYARLDVLSQQQRRLPDYAYTHGLDRMDAMPMYIESGSSVKMALPDFMTSSAGMMPSGLDMGFDVDFGS